MPTSLNPHVKFLLALMRLLLGLLNEDVADRFDILPTKSSFMFFNLDKIIEQFLKIFSCLVASRSNSR